YNLHLSRAELNQKYGDQLETASNQVLHQRMSQKKGIWADANERWQSPLENMVPEVRVGNQTALRSRKHPFARYIATMHRAIHDRWAWGYLDSLDSRSPSHPLNKPELWTR